MDLVIKSLEKDILELRNHVEFIENLKGDILTSSINYNYSTSSSRRKFEYKSVIITLYGIIEHYIEKFIFEYIELIEKSIPIYSCLDKKFTDQHFVLSINLINKIIENRHIKYSTLCKELVVKNLNNCLMDIQNNYSINKEAYTINTGNMKHSKICDSFKSLNIKINEKLLSVFEIHANTENAFNKIDDLVQRRNEIAHGNDQDILDASELRPFIDFIEKYLRSIGKILEDEITNLRNLYIKKHHSVFIESVSFYRGNIIGIENGQNMRLKCGDEILIERSDNSTFTCNILEVRNHENNDVTLKLSRNIKKNQKFYLFNKRSYKLSFATKITEVQIGIV